MINSLIELQEKEVQVSVTIADKEQAEQLLSALREQAKWKFVRDLPPLFSLYQHEDGRWLAELSPDLQARANALLAKTHTDGLVQAIATCVNEMSAMAKFPPGSPLASVCAKTLYQTLHQGLIPRLDEIVRADDKEKKILAKRLMNDLEQSIDHLASPEGIRPHKSAAAIMVNDEHGHPKSRLLEEVAIEMARTYAQIHQELPTKAGLRAELEKAYTDLLELSEGKWSKLWPLAGLDSLPHAKHWTAK